MSNRTTKVFTVAVAQDVQEELERAERSRHDVLYMFDMANITPEGIGHLDFDEETLESLCDLTPMSLRKF